MEDIVSVETNDPVILLSDFGLPLLEAIDGFLLTLGLDNTPDELELGTVAAVVEVEPIKTFLLFVLRIFKCFLSVPPALVVLRV